MCCRTQPEDVRRGTEALDQRHEVAVLRQDDRARVAGRLEDLLVIRTEEPDVADGARRDSEGLLDPRSETAVRRSRGSSRYHGVVKTVAGEAEAGTDVLRLPIGQLLQNLLSRQAVGEKVEDIGDANPHSADARTTSALAGTDRDPVCYLISAPGAGGSKHLDLGADQARQPA
jgi:hypothetical protein